MSADGIDLWSPAFVADPYPTYRRLREADPVRWLPYGDGTGGIWCLSRYEDVAAALKDARLSKDPARVAPPEQLSALDQSMLFRDPPDHARLRSLVGQAFTPKRVRDLEPRIAAIAAGLLAQAGRADAMEFMREFAAPLPVIVIAELLGVPPEDRATFRAWSNQVVGTSEGDLSDEESVAQVRGATEALEGYFAELIRRRRDDRRDDLISGLIAARDVGERLSEQELIGTCILLLIAGHETTVNLLGNGLLTLLRHPAQLARLRAHPELIERAVEEMLRYESPVQQATFRVAVEEMELGGTRVERGHQVMALLGAANRDPDRFPDPDRFDVAREPSRHLAFGLGMHFCLGAPLARLEAHVAFPMLLRELPELRLAGEPAWNANAFIRGLRSLPIAYTPTADHPA